MNPPSFVPALWLVLSGPALAYDVCPTTPGVLEQTPCTASDPADCLYAPNRAAGTFTRYPTAGNITLYDADALGQPNRPVPLLVNIPSTASGPLPVVILSHGGSLGVTNPANVMQEWFQELPKWGYVTIVVAHWPRGAVPANALCSALGVVTTCPQGPAWDRPQDIATVMDWVEDQASLPGSALYGKADPSRIAVLGHSGGASGAVLLAGAERTFGYTADGTPIHMSGYDPRVDAIVALSAPGPLSAGMSERSYVDVDLPFLVVSGAGDDDNDPLLNPYGARAEMYYLADAPEQFRLFIDDLAARHDTVNLKATGECLAWADAATCADFTTWVRSSSLAFLDGYLQCDPAAHGWLESDGVTVASGGGGRFAKRPAQDTDGDWIVDGLDVCPGFDDRFDADADLVPDDCDACPADAENDADDDGLCGDVDNCAADPNPNQSDADADGLGDACEPDSDGDGVIDDFDVCRYVPDPDQVDADQDGVGDTCDEDDDGDGVADGNDACLYTAAGAPVLPSGCSLAQECDCATPWKNHGAYVSCVTHAGIDLVGLGLVDEVTHGALVSEAAESSCGG